ncbi:ESCRT-II complex subunit-domain-containing protein [Schizophyllum amplum]|uniref:ESCRT-II complex subunit-domain-containing protein n=1 Tax=Schizophyllum amplum TaxID=97359 RepID=A0A550BZA8_9AGAR|nr:ESCRT-II complex subunit-domain-containing protein [Auriculariopsis ampla]
MALRTYETPSGFKLPSIHSFPPFYTQQPNPSSQSAVAEQWSRLILAYARHRKLFVLRVEDAETSGGDWDEILRNERINRRLPPAHLESIMASMTSRNQAAYEPAKQTRAALIYWRTPDEWAEELHQWVASTGQLGTIMTFYEIIEPPVESPLSGIPISLLKKAIGYLSRAGRAQLIGVADGEGVRFFQGPS